VIDDGVIFGAQFDEHCGKSLPKIGTAV
jgi:hypothetical protein